MIARRSRRTVGIALVMLVGLVGIFFGLWPGEDRQSPRPDPPSPRESIRIPPGWDPKVASSLPRFLPSRSSPSDRPMPRALASDLARFNDVQLRAELESLGLSFPGIELGNIFCPTLPCRAEASSTQPDRMAGFVDAVNQRFQGFVNTELGSAAVPAGSPLITARFTIGVSRRQSPP